MKKKYDYKGPQKELSSAEKYTAKQAQEFWKSPKKVSENDIGRNDPCDYLSFNDGRTEMLFNKIREILPDTGSKILELGPNAGRNLSYLHENGYKDLYGIEINAEAVALMHQKNPLLAKNITIDTIEEGILKMHDKEFDLVFSMAVLEHISNDSDFIFDHIKRISSKFIIYLFN